MSNSDNFIKDIEKFFLSLSQKGIMLSSKDYFLIKEWMDKGYTREHVYRGIRDAFENKTRERIRNISDCIEYVENIDEKPDRSEQIKSSSVETSRYVEKIIINFEHIIQTTKHPNILKLLNNYKDKLSVLHTSEENVYEITNNLENEFFNSFPDIMDQIEREKIENKINEALNNSNDYINEESKKKALNIQLKNLIIKEYINLNPFDTDL